MNITNPKIKTLEPGHIFVFGSNERGKHELGAAKFAQDECGAKLGQSIGIQGNSWAIPVKDIYMKPLPLWKIKIYVDDFTKYVFNHPEFHYDIIEIGCGLAKYKAEQIAPFFRKVSTLKYVSLPEKFWEELNRQ